MSEGEHLPAGKGPAIMAHVDTIEEWTYVINDAMERAAVGEARITADYFIIGDLWNDGVQRWGEEKVIQALPENSFGRSRLINIARVAKLVVSEDRRPELSISHHEEVAALPSPDQREKLAKAVDEELSKLELRKEVRGAPPGGSGPYSLTPDYVDAAASVLLGDPLSVAVCYGMSPKDTAFAVEGAQKSWLEDGLETILELGLDTTSYWWASLWGFQICFPDHKVPHLNRQGNEEKGGVATAFVFLSEDKTGHFVSAFSPYGPVVSRVVGG